MYSYAEVFYKTDDTPGWKVAILSGDEECVKQKASKLWKNYKIFSGNTCAYEVYDVYPAMPEPEMVHMTSNWIYSRELDKWFFPEEDIPLPVSKCNTSKTLNINYDFTEGENKIDDLINLYLEISADGRDEVWVTLDFIVETDNKSFDMCLQYSDKVEADIQKFLSTIKTKKYAYLIFEEYDFIKILAWNNDGKSRIKVQSYNSHDEVKELLDFECTTNCFISAFEDFLKSITVQYKEINDIVRKEANKEAYGR